MTMAPPYSEDMRSKALAAVKRGERKSDVSKMFGISRNTLDLWLKREAATGSCRPITNYQQGCGTKSRIGNGFECCSNSMGARRKHNLQRCGAMG